MFSGTAAGCIRRHVRVAIIISNFFIGWTLKFCIRLDIKTLTLVLSQDKQILSLKLFAGYTEYLNLIYKHWISELVQDIQTLNIRTFTGYTNIGYQSFYWTYKHWISELLVDIELLLDIQTLDIRTLLNIGHWISVHTYWTWKL